MSTALATVITTYPRTFGYLVRTRRDHLGLTRKQATAAGGPTIATLHAIEAGTASHLTASALTQLDAALQWPSVTAYRFYTDTYAVAQHFQETTVDPNQLLGAYRALERLDTPPSVLAAIADHLDTELRPRLQGLLAGLQAHELITVYQLAHGVLDAPHPSQTPPPRTHTVHRSRPRGRQHRPIPQVPCTQGPPIALREYRIVHTGWNLDEAVARLTEERRRTDPTAGPITRGTMSAIETGQRGMSIEMAHALETIYQLTPETLACQIRSRHAAAN
ncbi:hypothetical protein [Mycobacteroides abscessus]